MPKCGKNCEVYSRVVGYYQPVQQWNLGKKSEFKDRVAYKEDSEPSINNQCEHGTHKFKCEKGCS